MQLYFLYPFMFLRPFPPLFPALRFVLQTSFCICLFLYLLLGLALSLLLCASSCCVFISFFLCFCLFLCFFFCPFCFSSCLFYIVSFPSSLCFVSNRGESYLRVSFVVCCVVNFVFRACDQNLMLFLGFVSVFICACYLYLIQIHIILHYICLKPCLFSSFSAFSLRSVLLCLHFAGTQGAPLALAAQTQRHLLYATAAAVVAAAPEAAAATADSAAAALALAAAGALAAAFLLQLLQVPHVGLS